MYPKGAEARAGNDQNFINELNKYLVKDIPCACARNTSLGASPSHPKSDFIYKRVFADFL